jgi:hypothetical protein
VNRIVRVALVLALVTFGVASTALAAPFTLTTVLRGDPRPANPDNLEVAVSITGDTDSRVTYWTVDLNMPIYHPNARLDEFGFNLVGARTNYTFSNFNLPYTPTMGTLNGSGGTTFLLTLDDPSGHRSDATNIRNLTFQVTNLSRNFTLNDFLLAPTSCSNDSLLGCNQIGAHLQALNGGDGSGIATGNYPAPPPPPPPPVSVPEPGTMLLVALGATVAAFKRART